MPPDPTPIASRAPVIPVLTIERIEDAAPLAAALIAGGLPVLEVTLRTPVAIEAVRRIAAEHPEACVGVGTVRSPGDAEAAIVAGAKFLVSPGTPPALAEALAVCGTPALPGCATVSEAIALFDIGFRLLKFFPAEASGGLAWLKAVAGPLPEVGFCPTGGVGAENAASYLALPNVPVVGGTWVAPREAIRRGDFAAITALARSAAQLRPV